MLRHEVYDDRANINKDRCFALSYIVRRRSSSSHLERATSSPFKASSE